MFGKAWKNRVEGRDVCQSHLDSLPWFPPRLIDRGASGDTILSYPFAASLLSQQRRNLRQPREGRAQVRTPRSAPVDSQREMELASASAARSDNGDEEEQLHPC